MKFTIFSIAFALVAAIAAAPTEPAHDFSDRYPVTGPFAFKITSASPKWNGKFLTEGASGRRYRNMLVPTNKPDAVFWHNNTELVNDSYIRGEIQYNTGPAFPPVKIEVDYITNMSPLVIPWFAEPGEGDNDFSFDKSDKLSFWQDDRFYGCNMEISNGICDDVIAWKIGAGKPDLPNCEKVTIRKVKV